MTVPDAISDLGPDFVKFWQHWDALPKDDLLPHLSDYLDSVVPELQPLVSMMDILSPSDMRIRLLGTRITDMIGELTGSTAETLYAGQIRQLAMETSWRAVDQPCGYAVKRTLRSRSGASIDSAGLVLPMARGDDGRRTLVSFNGIPRREYYLDEEMKVSVETVQAFGPPTWIDVGAGLPA
jgi:hypothetical protein